MGRDRFAAMENIQALKANMTTLERKESPEPIHIISLGAGVQSYTMQKMAELGEISPMPVASAFADTDWELDSTTELVKEVQKNSPWQVHILKKRSLREIATNCTKQSWWPGLPVFTKNDDGTGGMLGRKCTTSFKVQLLEQFSKSEMKRLNAPKVIQWKGITIDEVWRMKPSRKKWYDIRWPLIEKRMNRNDCMKWLRDHGLKIPERSACITCPFHSDGYWRWLKSTHPDKWDESVRFDEHIRNNVKGAKFECFLHRSLVPLSQVDLSTEEDHGQQEMFNSDCQGMCGV